MVGAGVPGDVAVAFGRPARYSSSAPPLGDRPRSTDEYAIHVEEHRLSPATDSAKGSFLLDREELPADLRAQLAAIGDWRSTIAVPVPLDGSGWEEVEVAGRPAIAFGDDSGLGALVLRQDADGVTVVGGRIGVGRALELADQA